MKLQFLNRFQREPITLATAALIAGAANAAAAGGQAVATGKMNRKNRRFAERMYIRQQQDARTQWDMQNAYNSPTQQMQRLREAGLNPHLIYGSGGATSNAAPINQVPFDMPQQQVPQIGNIGAAIGDTVSQYIEARRFQAQNKLVDAQTLKTLTEIDLTKLTIEQKTALFDTQKQLLGNLAQGKAVETEVLKARNTREEQTTAAGLTKTAAETESILQGISSSLTNQELTKVMIANGKSDLKTKDQARAYTQEQITQLQKDGKIKDFEIALNKLGLTKSDPNYARVLTLGVKNAIGAKPTAEETQWIKKTFGQKAGAILDAIFSKNFWLGGK